MDFDDLLVLLARLFDEQHDVQRKYQQRYHYVLIDEYQDTNHAQYRIAKQLTEAHGNLFVVGDEDQSIYSWRGADIRNILDFETDFPDARVFRLEENYRSTAPILAAANAVVANNIHRLGKTLWTARKSGEPVRCRFVDDGRDEAEFVAEDILAGEIAPREVAVLFRTNGQSRLMEEALRRKGLPYMVVGAVEFYGRKEVKDLVCYLRLIVNPNDDVALRRVLNVPPRGIGGVTLGRLEEYAAARDLPLFSVVRDAETDQTLGAPARDAMGRFVHLMDDLTLASKTKPVASLLESLLGATAYRDYIRRSDEKDHRTRMEIIDEFVSACAQFDERSGGDLTKFLQELALLTDVDAWDPAAEAVTLMTCHSAKGLEFDHVFLIGLEEGLLPHASALGSGPEIEEERRLCYVAMTRGRKRLTLTAARSRIVYGERRECEPSRFLGEIPADQLAWMGRSGGGAQVRKKPGAGGVAVDPRKLRLGTRVRHARFGKGTVLYTIGSGPQLKARIRFQGGRSRVFMVRSAPLEILEGDDR